ncbi:MAG: DUF421 domain-containing protein [Phycisphaerae bacterium]
MQSSDFFTGWGGPLRVVVMAVCTYAGLILVLRLSGKRTLSQMNAFDLVITVAHGSVFATILLNRSVTLAQGLTAFAMLSLMQFVVAWLAVRSTAFDAAIKSNPTILFWRGRMIDETLKRERVTESEVRAAVRSQGIGSMEQVEAVVLETAGQFSVIPRQKEGPGDLLEGVSAPPEVDVPRPPSQGGPAS